MQIIDINENLNIRLDVFLAERLGKTRSAIKSLMDRELITLNGNPVKAGTVPKCGDIISIKEDDIPQDILAENLPIDVVFEDEHLAVVNKARGMVVHPSSNCFSGTLVNALLYHFKSLSLGSFSNSLTEKNESDDILHYDNNYSMPKNYRAGIVHRLDKETTGLMVVAKTDNAHLSLSKQIAEKTAKRIYHAILEGVVKEDNGTISANLDRDKFDRKKMAVCYAGGKTAVTDFKVLERFDTFTYTQFELRTGRTHQIRVHAKHIGHPVIGDKAYGFKKQRFQLDGQLLHSKVLSFTHPETKKEMVFESDLPEDFKKVLTILRKRQA